MTPRAGTRLESRPSRSALALFSCHRRNIHFRAFTVSALPQKAPKRTLVHEQDLDVSLQWRRFPVW